MFTEDQKNKVLVMVRETVFKYGAREVAEEIGKKYPTFMREVSPFDDAAKLSFIDFLAIFKAVDGDGAIRDTIAAEFGVYVDLLVDPDEDEV